MRVSVTLKERDWPGGMVTLDGLTVAVKPLGASTDRAYCDARPSTLVSVRVTVC